MDYRTMKFPAYKYQEYPKKLTLPGGKKVWVQSMREELEVLQSNEALVSVPPTAVEAERDQLAKDLALRDAELAALREQLAAAGAPKGVDGKTLDVKTAKGT